MDQAPLYHPKSCVIALLAIASAYPLAQAASRDFGAIGASSAAGTSAVSSSPAYYSCGSGITDRTIARRNEQIQSAQVALNKGRENYRNQKYEEALQDYKQALDILPNAPVTEKQREFIIQSIGDASVAVAQQYAKVGRYDEARQLLLDAIKINPKNGLAERELTFLDDPIRNNPAKTPQYVKDVEEVNRLLHMAYGYYDLGQYDHALGEFNKVLRIDPYNVAARRGQETVFRRKHAYYESARNEARAEALNAVSALWETPVPAEVPDVSTSDTSGADDIGATANLKKLRQIIIPRVDFEDTPVEDAIEFLRQRSRELDSTGSAEKGINFVFNASQGPGMAAPSGTAGVDLGVGDGALEGDATGATPAPAAPTVADIGSRRIKELKLNNVPMLEVLKFICQNAGLRYKVEDYAVQILPAGGDDTDLYSRTFSVPADFISRLEASVGDGGGEAAPDPFATGGSSGASGIKPRRPVKDLFKQLGIPFGEGCSATYIPGSSNLLVRNTTANLDLIEQYIEQIKGRNKQIKIMTKFIEITQDNTDELSFDWVVTPFSVNNGRSLFAGGGNAEGTGTTASDFAQNPGGVNNWPISSTSDAVNGLSTGGIRSGNSAIRGDSLDSLVQSQNRTEANANHRAPGIMSLTGIYDEGAFQMIMRGLSQKKGSDMLTAPSILAKPDATAKIEIIREFIYPTEYEPPQIPTNAGNNYRDNYNGGGSVLGNTGLLGSTSQPQVNSFPVTPANPGAFETRSVGVTLEVKANVEENSYVIDLEFEAELVEFEGFVNYGSPIQSTGVGSDGKPVAIVLTDNRIEQPIFSTRRVKSQVSIYDGYTIGVGGLITESVQTVEDKVPVFGDLPFVGRFFRGNSENHNKKNLMIFVTAQVVDATGQPIRGRNVSSGLPSGSSDTDHTLLPPSL